MLMKQLLVRHAFDPEIGSVLEELLGYEGDILSLQEVDHYDDFFAPKLEAEGYTGEFLKRPSAHKQDGCAVFYRTARFDCLQIVEVLFDDLASP